MKEFNDLAKKLEGTVLTIGFADNETFIKTLNKNNKVSKVYTLSNESGPFKFKKSKKFKGKKVLNIKKLNKEFKQEKFDYIFCNFNAIIPFFRSFVVNTIMLANKKVFLYVEGNDYELTQINYRYERYDCDVVKKSIKNETIFTISTKDIKINNVKKFLFWFKDIRYDIVEFIANILIG